MSQSHSSAPFPLTALNLCGDCNITDTNTILFYVAFHARGEELLMKDFVARQLALPKVYDNDAAWFSHAGLVPTEKGEAGKMALCLAQELTRTFCHPRSWQDGMTGLQI